MKKVLLSFFILNTVLIFATDTTRSGKYLFIAPGEPCVVYLDGEKIGNSPLFISNLSPSDKLLQLRGEYAMAETELLYDTTIDSVTRYAPQLGKYYGSMSIFSNIGDAKIRIDGVECEGSVGVSIKLDIGPHLVSIAAEGFIPEQFVVVIPRLESVRLDIELKRAIRVSIAGQLPAGTMISFVDAATGKILKFDDPEAIAVSSGDWTAVFESPLFEGVELPFSVADDPVDLHPVFAFYRPVLKFLGLAPDSRIYLGDDDVTDKVTDSKLSVPVGRVEVLISRQNYLPITYRVMANGNQEIELVIDYQIDPEIVRKNLLGTSAALSGAGASVLAGGLILANNRILLSISRDYETYRSLKYTAWGTEAAGLALLAASGILTAFILAEDE